MTFYSNGIALGPPVAVDSSEIPPFASFSISQPPLGQNSLTAEYSGDTNYAGSTSSAISFELVAANPPFSITPNPWTISIASPGQSGSTTLTFTAQTGFTGSTALTPSMCSNLPSNSSCTFGPASVNFTSSTTTVPVTLTITTTASSSAALFVRRFIPGLPGAYEIVDTGVIWVWILLLSDTRRRRWTTISALLALAVIALAVGCGGGSPGGGGGGGGIGGGNSGTPTGNYTMGVTVTINGVTESITSLIVNVQ